MARGDARPSSFERFGELSPDRFESLVFRLAWLEDRRAVRLLAPDGGLDTIVPDDDRPGRAARGWQAKRHTGRIDWEDCQQSLDRAVSTWQPRTVTFVFPRDLRAAEHQTFAERLATRHAGVHVDYWAASHLIARFASRDGQRVRDEFFEPHDAHAIAERMLRASSPLRTGEDFVAAERALGDATADAAGPDYDWVVHRTPAGSPEPTPRDSAMLRLAFGGEHETVYADLLPRSRSPEKVPGMTIAVDDSPEGRQAKAWLDELMRSGGRLSLRDGIDVAMRDVPAPFGDLVGDLPRGALNVRVVQVAAPLYARLTADPDGEPIGLDVDLHPVDPPDEWDAVLAGRLGDLKTSLSFRWLVHEGRGESRLTFRYSPAGAPHAIQAATLRWLIAVGRSGSVELSDRVGTRPTVVQSDHPQGVEPWMEPWAILHENLATLEQAAGRSMPPVPDQITGEHYARLAQIADILRAGQVEVTVHEPSITVASEAAAKVGGVLRDVRLEATAVASVFGVQIPVARQVMHLPPMIVRAMVAVPGGWQIHMVPLGAPEARVIAELIPLSHRDDNPC